MQVISHTTAKGVFKLELDILKKKKSVTFDLDFC